MKLNGFALPEDFIAWGRDLKLPLLVNDYGLKRWTGANSYRTSPYPYNEEEMQWADREHFLFIDEISALSLQFENDVNAVERLRMLALTGRLAGRKFGDSVPRCETRLTSSRL